MTPSVNGTPIAAHVPQPADVVSTLPYDRRLAASVSDWRQMLHDRYRTCTWFPTALAVADIADEQTRTVDLGTDALRRLLVATHLRAVGLRNRLDELITARLLFAPPTPPDDHRPDDHRPDDGRPGDNWSADGDSAHRSRYAITHGWGQFHLTIPAATGQAS